MPMLTEDQVRSRQPISVTSSPSLVTDLAWLLLVALNPSMQEKYPRLAEVLDGREDLTGRVCTFWPEDADERSFTELQALAQYAGVTRETDPALVWPALEAAVARVPLQVEMPSEYPEMLDLVAARFRMLKQSPELVRSYVDLLQDVWAPVNDVWQQSLPVIEEAGRLAVAQYESGQSLDLLITPGCDILRDRLPGLVDEVGTGALPLLFVPCLFHGSSMYLEFPDLVVFGMGVGQGDALARVRTESVARRLKAVADPTRLAILTTLATASSSVGELAVLFRIAQPTVSMHVKVLRECGLVTAERAGGRLRLSVDAAAVESLLDDLRLAVLRRD